MESNLFQEDSTSEDSKYKEWSQDLNITLKFIILLILTPIGKLKTSHKSRKDPQIGSLIRTPMTPEDFVYSKNPISPVSEKILLEVI